MFMQAHAMLFCMARLSYLTIPALGILDRVAWFDAGNLRDVRSVCEGANPWDLARNYINFDNVICTVFILHFPRIFGNLFSHRSS